MAGRKTACARFRLWQGLGDDCHVGEGLALGSACKCLFDAFEDAAGLLCLLLLAGRLRRRNPKEVRGLGGQLFDEVGEEGSARPLLQLAELLRLVAGGLRVDELAQQPLPELWASLENRGTREAGPKVGDVPSCGHSDSVAVPVHGLNHDVGVEKVGGDHVGREGC